MEVRSELLRTLLGLLSKGEKGEKGEKGDKMVEADSPDADGTDAEGFVVVEPPPPDDVGGLVQKMMADPVITAALRHSKIQPVVAKVLADPSILTDAPKMQAELGAIMADGGDAETAKILMTLAPKLAELRQAISGGTAGGAAGGGGHSLHWRYELMAAWCVLNTLQATYSAHSGGNGMGPSRAEGMGSSGAGAAIGASEGAGEGADEGVGEGEGEGAGESEGDLQALVWRLFVRALKAGAGQPMQKLALASVMSMVSGGWLAGGRQGMGGRQGTGDWQGGWGW